MRCAAVRAATNSAHTADACPSPGLSALPDGHSTSINLSAHLISPAPTASSFPRIPRALSPSTFSWWSRRSRPCSCPSTPNSPATRSCLRSGLLVTSSLTVRSQPTKKFSAKRKRSEEHTSELQSHSDLVCRLLLEKKKKKK